MLNAPGGILNAFTSRKRAKNKYISEVIDFLRIVDVVNALWIAMAEMPDV